MYTPHIHWVPWGTGTPKDKDELFIMNESYNKDKTYE
jgi:hypothetical protein